MSLTTDDFTEFIGSEVADDEEVRLGALLEELSVDLEVDAVEEVRDVRERV
jgi:hypothetical protein